MLIGRWQSGHTTLSLEAMTADELTVKKGGFRFKEGFLLNGERFKLTWNHVVFHSSNCV